ncbi:MAG TPA: beta-1,3-glucanase family protein [Polyangiaceae bacterium]|jgi:hypothetical protein|nr:beta-1,3-glucanase family protein [Polyangiaceae bacterium]
MVNRARVTRTALGVSLFLFGGALIPACGSSSSSGPNIAAGAANSSSGSAGSVNGAAGSAVASGGQGNAGSASGGQSASAGTSSGVAGSVANGGNSSSGSANGGNANGGASSAGNSGSAGSAGSPMMTHPGQCIYPPQASERKAPPFTLPAPQNPAGLVLRLMNNCPQDLWVHANGIPNGVVELAGKQAGQAPTEQVYDWPGLSGRMSVNEGSANGYNVNFIEMNANKQALNVNLSNVDWVGLPVEVRGNDPSKCLTACYTPLAQMMNGCPQQLLDTTHHVCQAPKDWCANANNAQDPLCTALDAAGAAVIANDPKCKAGGSIDAAGTGWKIYGCAGNNNENFWDQNPYCCAEVNRGYLSDVNDPAKDETQNCNYYKTMPFSTYSAYAQTVCPFVYSFAYDDVNNQSGFQSCQGATEMDVTWCPGDP